MRRLTTTASRLIILGISAICAAAVPALAEEKLPYDLARYRLAGLISDEDGRAKIYGGQRVNPPNKYPFQVGLIASRADPGLERRGQFCGGSLIAETWVLTASHCVIWKDDTTGEVAFIGPQAIDVYAGSANFKDGDRIEVKKVIPHRSFNHTTKSSDIALLQLARAPKRGWKIETVDYKAAAVDRSLTAEGRMTTVIGWGRTRDQPEPENLIEVGVPIAGNAVCDQAIRTYKIEEAKKLLDAMALLTDMDDATYQARLREIEAYTGGVDTTMMCAGFAEGGKDSCQGDSGGPLFATTPDGKFTQLGVVSWGWGCGLPEVRGVYARVSEFKDWIEQNMDSGQ